MHTRRRGGNANDLNDCAHRSAAQYRRRPSAANRAPYRSRAPRTSRSTTSRRARLRCHSNPAQKRVRVKMLDMWMNRTGRNMHAWQVDGPRGFGQRQQWGERPQRRASERRAHLMNGDLATLAKDNGVAVFGLVAPADAAARIVGAHSRSKAVGEMTTENRFVSVWRETGNRSPGSPSESARQLARIPSTLQ